MSLGELHPNLSPLIARPVPATESLPIEHDGIRALFGGRGVFVTGATGFVGKTLLEKVLRDIPTVSTVYLLVRARKGRSADERLQNEIVGSKIFDRLRRERGPKGFAELMSKVVAVPGDISHENCGVSEDMQARIRKDVHIVVHCAATIDFQERIDISFDLNLFGTMRVFDLVKHCDLKAFVHVSTAFVNANRPGGNLEEKLYPFDFDPEDIIAQVSEMDVAQLQNFGMPGSGKPAEDWPNTYTFTKAITEHLLVRKKEREAPHIPLAIIRPSIISGSLREPVPGWIDDIAAIAAIYAAAIFGLVRILNLNVHQIIDVIPVDMVVNTILHSAAAVAHKKVGNSSRNLWMTPLIAALLANCYFTVVLASLLNPITNASRGK